MRRDQIRPRGLSLLEVLFTAFLFSFVGVLSFLVLSRGVHLWTEISEAESAGLELAKATNDLRVDLLKANSADIRSGEVPANLSGGGMDGAALWFLSAVDPESGEFVMKSDGTPYWQRNILYYLVTPTKHETTYGYNCAGGKGADGFDDRCPHKILVRKVIDSGAPTGPDGDPILNEETLLSDPGEYLTRPVGYDVGAMNGEPDVDRVDVAAVRLLWFRPSVEGRTVVVDIRAVAIKGAQKALRIGETPLAEGRFTVHRLLSVTPMN
jgi:hypothetical protein